MKGKVCIHGEWFLVHKARVNNLPTRHTRHETNKPCRNCGYYNESNWHALSNSRAAHRFVVARHNQIVEILGKFLKENLVRKADWTVEIEKSAIHFAQHRVPDIQIMHKFWKNYWIIYVKCTYDSPSNMTRRDEWNQAKYDDVVTATRDSLGPIWDVRILSFVIGCLGSWYTGVISLIQSPDNSNFRLIQSFLKSHSTLN